MSKNSLTTLLNDMLKLSTDSYTIMTKVSEIVSSNADTVSLDLSDSDGTIKRVVVPSFGALMEQMRKLENDIQSLAGVGQRSSSVQLSDGKFRKLLTSTLKKEAADISAMAAPTTFSKRENWFFESFLSPLLYVSFDLTGQVKSNTETVQVNRYILNLDTAAKRAIFDENFLGSSTVSFQEFVEILRDNEITYFLDEDVIALPPRSVRYFGKFAVMDMFDDTETTAVDGVEYQQRSLRLRLDVLQYNDRESRFVNTQQLKVGDSLVVNSDTKNTRYEITAIDAPTRTVSVRCVEGFDLIQIGADSLLYYDENEEEVSVNVNIGFNESCVVFIKPVDPDSKIASVNWSPGVGFRTNDLTIVDEGGREWSLSQYYQNSVVDFGTHIYSLAKDKIPPAAFGVDPSPPTLDAANFKVVQVNEHATSNSAFNELKKLQAEKTRLQGSITTLDRSVKDLRAKIETTNYPTQKLEDTDRSELAKLISDRNSASSLHASTVDTINKLAVSTSVSDLLPKYRVRGFFPIPEPKTTDRTLPQEVVQFVVQYRYVKKDGSANQPEQLTFKDNSGVDRRGTFSTWVEERSPVRRRVMDEDTGAMSWGTEDVEDGDAVNINQIDIPVSPNEAVEIRIKSLSEAGWPVSPRESVWSSIVRVDFPPDLESQQTVAAITEEAKQDKLRVDIRGELGNMGVVEHLNGMFVQNGKTFSHTAKDIASGFVTAEQVAISLYDMLSDMQTSVQELRSLIEKAKGKLVVKVSNEIGEEFTVQPNETLRLFAGNYRDQVASRPVKKGVIITTNYFVMISNDAASDLELYSREFGDRYFKITPSVANDPDYNANDVDYNRIRRYDYVPMALSNPDPSDVSNYGFIRTYPEQSSQVLGQFVGLRYKSIDGRTNLYSEVNGATYGVFNSRSLTMGATAYLSVVTEDVEYALDAAVMGILTSSASVGATTSGDFIWKGGTNNGWVISSTDPDVQASYANSILVHINHPLIRSWAGSASDADANLAAQDAVRNSIFANQSQGSTGWDRQNALFYEGAGGTADKYGKIGFVDTDQYLIGPLSCGAYLFANVKAHDAVTVTGSDSQSYKKVRFGTRDSITVPVTFQYRMTDYFGSGDVGLGNVGGDPFAGTNKNIVYVKTIGFDIYSNPVDRERFSFDLEVTARYYSNSLVSKDTPLRTFENAFDDLSQSLNLTPGTSRDVRP